MRSTAFVIWLGAFAASAAHAAAPPVQPNEAVAQSALVAFLRTSDDSAIAARMTAAREEVASGALRAPQELRVANVVLARGVTGAGVQFLLGQRGLQLVGIEARCPTKGPANVVVAWMDQQRIGLASATTIEEKVDKAIGHERFEFHEKAQILGSDPQQAATVAQLREVGMSHEFAAYRLEVLGTRAALHSLSREPMVRAVFVTESAALVEVVQNAERAIDNSTRGRGPTVRMGRVDPGKPLPYSPRGDLALAIAGFPGRQASRDLLEPQHAELRRLADESATRRLVAVVMLDPPLTPQDAEHFLQPFRVEMQSCAARIHTGGTYALPVELYHPRLAVHAGGTALKIERAAEIQRARFEERLPELDRARQEAWRKELADGEDIQVFRLDLVGEAAELVRLIDAPQVLGVVPSPDPGAAERFDAKKRCYAMHGVPPEREVKIETLPLTGRLPPALALHPCE